ncbi:hypothetical protein Syun_015081 [Stephania yunnanensis]|uniref:Uncharacterized protein n=1 Tax=Stephania yunnanensis TaxID=152371 RepID=A0AAP0JLL5_9MAGN
MCIRSRIGKGGYWMMGAMRRSLTWKMRRMKSGGELYDDEGVDGDDDDDEVERVFKSLIGTRVSLLNLFTHNNCC